MDILGEQIIIYVVKQRNLAQTSLYIYSELHQKSFENSEAIMKHPIHVPSFGLAKRTKLSSPSRIIKEDVSHVSSSSVSRIKKTSLPRLHRTLLVQVNISADVLLWQPLWSHFSLFQQKTFTQKIWFIQLLEHHEKMLIQ